MQYAPSYELIPVMLMYAYACTHMWFQFKGIVDTLYIQVI
jgi:hypothetical protein